jgi:hypothetical protein
VIDAEEPEVGTSAKIRVSRAQPNLKESTAGRSRSSRDYFLIPSDRGPLIHVDTRITP